MTRMPDRILPGNDPLKQSRYILTVAREKIAALNYDDDDHDWRTYHEGCDAAQDAALAIIDALIAELNV